MVGFWPTNSSIPNLYQVQTTSAATTLAYWVQTQTQTSATTTNLLWTGWPLPEPVRYPGPVWRPEVRSPAPRLAAPAIIRQRETEHEAAKARARALLVGELTRKQRAQFEAEGFFIVTGRRGVYRIRRGVAGNIDVLDPAGGVRHHLCVHPSDPTLPAEDVMLAQLIHLRHAEDDLLRIANVHRAPGLRLAA